MRRMHHGIMSSPKFGESGWVMNGRGANHPPRRYLLEELSLPFMVLL